MKLTEEEISERLADFHRQLQTNLPLCDISFAGGWARRNPETNLDQKISIPNALEKAFLNEKIAKHTWKKQMSEGGEFSDILGKRTHCATCADVGQNWLNEQKIEQHCFENEIGPPSLILKLDQSSTEPLKKESPVVYRN